MSIEETFRYDNRCLDNGACKRIFWLIAEPLMMRGQLDAIFIGFEKSNDGGVSIEALERMLKMLDPYKRLQKLKPIDVPLKPNPIVQMQAKVSEVVAPGLAAFNNFLEESNLFQGGGEDEEDDYTSFK